MSGLGPVYRSTHPEVLGAWEEQNARHVAWHDAVKEFRSEYPDHKPCAVNWGDAKHLLGLTGAESPGPVWRFMKARDCWVPDKRTKAGKALAARIDALRVTGLGSFPGMPHEIWEHAPEWYSHGLQVIAGVVWVTWSEKLTYEKVEATKTFDPAYWERARGSEYLRAVEDADLAEVAS